MKTYTTKNEEVTIKKNSISFEKNDKNLEIINFKIKDIIEVNFKRENINLAIILAGFGILFILGGFIYPKISVFGFILVLISGLLYFLAKRVLVIKSIGGEKELIYNEDLYDELLNLLNS